MMPLRRTPLLPPGWGLSPPRCASIGASSAAGSAASAARAGHGGGRGSGVAQTAFCQTRHFSEIFGVLRRRSRRRTGGRCRLRTTWLFSPSLLPVSACVSLAGRVCVRVGARKPGPFGSFIPSSPVPRPNCWLVSAPFSGCAARVLDQGDPSPFVCEQVRTRACACVCVRWGELKGRLREAR